MFDLRRPNSTYQFAVTTANPPVVHHHALLKPLDDPNGEAFNGDGDMDLAFAEAKDAFDAIHAWPTANAERSNYMCASNKCDVIKALADMPTGIITEAEHEERRAQESVPDWNTAN